MIRSGSRPDRRGTAAAGLVQAHWGWGGTSARPTSRWRYTKVMAHHFVQAPHHLAVEPALRWGQVRGLGGSRTWPWRWSPPVWAGRSRARNSGGRWSVPRQSSHARPRPRRPDRGLPARPAVRPAGSSDRGRRLGGTGAAPTGPHDEGRATPSLALRRSPPGTRSCGVRQDRPVAWKRSGIGEFRFVEPNGRRLRCWTIRELLSSDELYREGEAMRHCVATYAGLCQPGHLDLVAAVRGRPRRYRVMTIEVDLATRTVCQARRRGNAPPNAKIRGVL